MNNTEISQHAITWIDRLLVTRFKQGRQHLGDKKGGFCCLGLGCYINGLSYNAAGALNTDFTALVGLSHMSGIHNKDTDDTFRALVCLNDRGNSFNFIAKAMKAEPEAYFTPEVAKLISEHYGDKS